MASFLTVVRSTALLLARICLGGVLISHGIARWGMNGGPGAGIQGTVDFFSQFGVPYVQVVAWSVLSIEIVGGILLVAGALTPFVALLILVEQGFLIAYTTWYKNFPLLKDDGSYNGGWEYNAILGALALIFLVFGAGKVGVDSLFGRKKATEDDEFASSTSPSNSSSPTAYGSGTARSTDGSSSGRVGATV